MTPYEIELPWSSPPLSLNHRRGRWANAAKIREVRHAGCILAKHSKIGAAGKIRITLHYRPRDRRVRDAENPTSTLKALADGIVDAGIVEDDTPKFMVKDMPVIHESASTSGLKPRLWLVIEVLDRSDEAA